MIRFSSELEAESWLSYIRDEIRPAYTKPLMPGLSSRRLLVVVNPIGGKGKGEEIFHELLKPMLTAAGTAHEVIVTTGPLHAHKITQTMKLDEVGAIAVVGGDGLFGEVLNGLNSRPDRLEALDLRIGIVPAGSSNCLACSVGLRQPLAAAFSIARGCSKPLDVLKVTLENENVILSVCGVSYGFISEVNTHAGKWRWLFGPARYSVCGLRTILASPLKYHVDCRFQPPTFDHEEFDKTECGPDCVACARHVRSERALESPSQPKSPDKSYIRRRSSSAVVETVGATAPPEASTSATAADAPVEEANGEAKNWIDSGVFVDPRRRSLRPQMEQIDASTLLLFSITNLSIRQSQNKTVWNPHCHMASGYMDLVLMPVISRFQLIKFFSQFTKTRHMDGSVFSVIKAKSVEMKLTADQLPEWEKEIQIAIDGEVYPLQPLRVDTIHGLLNLMLS